MSEEKTDLLLLQEWYDAHTDPLERTAFWKGFGLGYGFVPGVVEVFCAKEVSDRFTSEVQTAYKNLLGAISAKQPSLQEIIDVFDELTVRLGG